ISLKTGFFADSQLPHAVDGLADDDLFQIISPLIKNPIFCISSIIKECNGMYGFLPKFATLIQALPPGTRTRCTSFQILLRNSLYSFNDISSSYSLPTLYGGEVTIK